jgi:hypothetical protein
MEDTTITIKLQDYSPNTYGIEISTPSHYWFKPVIEEKIPHTVSTALMVLEMYKNEALEKRMRLDDYVPF